VKRVLDLLAEHRLPAQCIEIELTEAVLQTGPATVATLESLAAHGIAIALDDFGTGYSSLASLETLPLTRIKLDRSLICGIGSNSRSTAVAEAMIDMCQGLGMKITAEGVETAEQFAFLMQKGSMFIQGFLLARPVPKDELVPLLAITRQRAHDLLLSCAVPPGLLPEPPTHLDRPLNPGLSMAIR
jgi:EAL domain-containing protein (putative c-di-GMP-specific phosphodiesterase class I)